MLEPGKQGSPVSSQLQLLRFERQPLGAHYALLPNTPAWTSDGARVCHSFWLCDNVFCPGAQVPLSFYCPWSVSKNKGSFTSKRARLFAGKRLPDRWHPGRTFQSPSEDSHFLGKWFFSLFAAEQNQSLSFGVSRSSVISAGSPGELYEIKVKLSERQTLLSGSGL